MESISKIHRQQCPLQLSLHQRPSLSRPIISISIKPPSKIRTSSVRATSSPLTPKPENRHQISHFETLKPFSALIKTTCVAIAATALFFGRFSKSSLYAAPLSQPNVESVKETSEEVSEEAKGKTLEKYLDPSRDDVEALRSLMEVKIKSGKIQEAIDLINRLIQIEPSEKEWPLLKAHLHNYSDEVELAKLGFEEIISKDPLFVEAYHGLVMTALQSESDELSNVLKRIEIAIETCTKEKKECLRDFKLLFAQVRFIEGNYMEALEVYQELVEEEPQDFRPYLCQGIIYSLLDNKDEAEKQFRKYRLIVPKPTEHPYAQYFVENMLTTTFFSQVAEN